MSWETFSSKNILTQIFRYQFLTVVHDKNSAYIQLDVVLLLPVFKQIKGCTSWDKQESSEFQLPFHREVLWESKIIILVSLHGSHFRNCLTTLQTQKAHSNHLRFQKKLSRQDTGQEQAHFLQTDISKFCSVPTRHADQFWFHMLYTRLQEAYVFLQHFPLQTQKKDNYISPFTFSCMSFQT